ncbi:MAG TPA: NYN domain-containing protein [Methylomirabilota bacterium]|nr:NYN domain-containing protein [Methylomirabilota bacterium]
MSKNVAVFVDVANIFFAAKAAGVDIDYVTLLKSASAGRDLVRAYAYTGLDPENENQRNFHDFLRRHGYKVVSKDIRKYGDGKVKANLDIELVVDMMKTARNLDIAIVVSGDGDFAPAIRAVQEMGVRCEVISFRGNTSSDLIEVADLFTDITQLARVEKGSRSGRRVADDDADLSMTEVPDKQTEGTGLGRGGRGRGGRGRGRSGEAEPVAASGSRSRGGRGRLSAPSTNGVASGRDGDAGLVALPGERLSKAVGNLTESDLAAAEVFTLDDVGEGAAEPVLGPVGEVEIDGDGTEIAEDDGGRRRRRRGGRGRGRGRGRDEAGEAATSPARPAAGPAPTPAFDVDDVDDEDIEEAEDEPVAPRAPRTTPFGSVWDSQLGTSSAAPAAANLAPLSDDDEDFDEPEIPEYLIAEQRRGARPGGARGGQGGNRGGPRGGRAAYQSAVERERYGGGRGGGGINRYPDVSGRTGGNTGAGAPPRPPREDRGFGRRDERPREAAPRASSSSEPWSEVPPELEAMLRAQVGQKPSPASDRSRPTETTPSDAVTADTQVVDADGTEAPEAPAPKRRATTRKPVASKVSSDGETAEPTPTKRPTARKPATSASTESASGDATGAATEADGAKAPKRRTTRKSTAASSDSASAAGEDGSETPAPKRRTTRKAATGSTEPA